MHRMPWFASQNVKFWRRIPVIVNRLALEDNHSPGSKAVQYSVDAYKPKSICEDTLMGTVGSEYAAIEGENRKFDTVDSRRIDYGDNVRSLLIFLAGLDGKVSTVNLPKRRGLR